MSIEDLLFSPIIEEVDFLVRKRPTSLHYDWKPISQRAISWSRAHYVHLYDSATLHQNGWMLDFSHWNCPNSSYVHEHQLIKDNYVFKEISP